MKERKSVTAVVAGRYRRAGKKDKGQILDEFTELTGYNRSYAAWVLRNVGKRIRINNKLVIVGDRKKKIRRNKPRSYDEKVLSALRKIWAIMDCICGKRGSVQVVMQKRRGHGIPYIGKSRKGGKAMTQKKNIISGEELKKVLGEQEDFLKPLVQKVVEEILEAEMEEALGAGKSQRTPARLGYRSGYYTRSLMTRVGKLELRVPQDRQGRFSTEVFERYQRSEKALVWCLAQMYIEGVSTRKIKAITEELCGHGFSASTVSQISKNMDQELEKFAQRALDVEYPYVILDAKYEKVRQDGVIRTQAVLIAIGINWEGRREVLGVELSNRESGSSWKEFLLGLRRRGLRGVELVISDDHDGLKKAVMEILTEAAWQRCYVHFLRNALDYLPRKADDDCLRELRWLYDRHGLEEARHELSVWLKKWGDKYPKLCTWVEDNIEETFTFYNWPRAHHKHIRSTNMLERINEEIKRRTYVIRIFPNEDSCLRLIRALLIEIHEDWIEQHRYLNMEELKEHKKAKLYNLERVA